MLLLQRGKNSLSRILVLFKDIFMSSDSFFTSLNAELDGQRGLMEFAGDATLMYYLMEEAQEGKNAFLEKRDPDFQKFPKFPG